LIRRGEEEWETKLKRASRTLSEAVIEYKRRYKRSPPKGFDDWYATVFIFVELSNSVCRWKYAQDHKVQLPDEYDFIHRDLEPFWGIDPSDLHDLQAAQEEIFDCYVLAKTLDKPTDVVKTTFEFPHLVKERALLRGADEIMDLLEPVEHLLPPFRILVSPHDNPNFLSDYFIKNATLEAAAASTCKYCLTHIKSQTQ